MAEEAKRSATDERTAQFPDDILIEILLRLPVRSLLLFKLVSKHWLRLIKNPNFIHQHINRPIDDDDDDDSPSNYSIVILRGNDVLTLLSVDETLPYKDDVALEVLSPSLNYGGWNPVLLSPCNGLFCITNKTYSVIFNPATKKCRKVPPSPLTSSPQTVLWYSCLGFGYDPFSCSYKLVKINQQLDAERDYPYRRDLRVEIYSLRNNSWRVINRVVVIAESPENPYAYQDYNVFFNGSLHKLYNSNKIHVFDLNKEDFEWFDLPCIFNEGWGIRNHLSVLNESLALIRHSVKFEIWVMMEYGVQSSWTQLYDIEPDVGIGRALSFSNKGEFIVDTTDGELASFDVKTMVIKLLNVKTVTALDPETMRAGGVSMVLDAFLYRESFISFM